MFAEAITEYEKVRVLVGSGPYGLSSLGSAYAQSGRTTEAKQILDQLLAFSKQGHAVSYGIALLHNGLGDKNAALQWLERACEEREPSVIYSVNSSIFDNLRSEPRFKALLKKIGLER